MLPNLILRRLFVWGRVEVFRTFAASGIDPDGLYNGYPKEVKPCGLANASSALAIACREDLPSSTE